MPTVLALLQGVLKLRLGHFRAVGDTPPLRLTIKRGLGFAALHPRPRRALAGGGQAAGILPPMARVDLRWFLDPIWRLPSRSC